MKTKVQNNMEISCDLSDLPKEVTDYLFDQLEDRIEHDMIDMVIQMEINSDYQNQKLEITSPVLNLIWKIIEEKQHDMKYEERHGEG